VFTDAERAALDYATEVTNKKGGRPRHLCPARAPLQRARICDIVWLVATEHLYNMSNIDLNIGLRRPLRAAAAARHAALGPRRSHRSAEKKAPAVRSSVPALNGARRGSPLRTRAAWQDPQGMDRQH